MKKWIICTFLGIYAGLFPVLLVLLFSPLITNIGIELLFLGIIILNTGMVIKIGLDYIRYGDKISPFKKVERHTYNEMIIAELSND